MRDSHNTVPCRREEGALLLSHITSITPEKRIGSVHAPPHIHTFLLNYFHSPRIPLVSFLLCLLLQLFFPPGIIHSSQSGDPSNPSISKKKKFFLLLYSSSLLDLIDKKENESFIPQTVVIISNFASFHNQAKRKKAVR